MNSRPHKQSMSELKLRRLTEHNQRLREDLARPRLRVSEASSRLVTRTRYLILHVLNSCPSLIHYCKTTKDHLVRGSPWPCRVGAAHLCMAGAISLGPCWKGRGPICTTPDRLQLRGDVNAIPYSHGIPRPLSLYPQERVKDAQKKTYRPGPSHSSVVCIIAHIHVRYAFYFP